MCELHTVRLRYKVISRLLASSTVQLFKVHSIYLYAWDVKCVCVCARYLHNACAPIVHTEILF